MRKNRKHSDEFKKKVVEEYLAGKGRKSVLREYDIVDSVLARWYANIEPLARSQMGAEKPRVAGDLPR